MPDIFDRIMLRGQPGASPDIQGDVFDSVWRQPREPTLDPRYEAFMADPPRRRDPMRRDLRTETPEPDPAYIEMVQAYGRKPTAEEQEYYHFIKQKKAEGMTAEEARALYGRALSVDQPEGSFLGNAASGFAQSMSDIVPIVGARGARWAESMDQAPPAQGVGGFLGHTAGSVAPTVAALAFPPLAPAVMANYAGVAAREKLDETGDPIAASAAGAMEGGAELLGYKLLSPIVGRIATALRGGNAGNATRVVLDHLSAMGVEASEEGVTLVGTELSDVATGNKSLEQAIENIARDLPMTLASGAVGGGMIAGTAGAARALMSRTGKPPQDETVGTIQAMEEGTVQDPQHLLQKEQIDAPSRQQALQLQQEGPSGREAVREEERSEDAVGQKEEAVTPYPALLKRARATLSEQEWKALPDRKRTTVEAALAQTPEAEVEAARASQAARQAVDEPGEVVIRNPRIIGIARRTDTSSPWTISEVDESFDQSAPTEGGDAARTAEPEPTPFEPPTRTEEVTQQSEPAATGAETPQFATYDEAQRWLNERHKDFSDPREYHTTDEYKALYPQIAKLYEDEQAARNKTIKAAMDEAGAKYGDRVQWAYVTPFGATEYTGKIVRRKNRPYVKFDEGQVTMSGQKSVPWHRGWQSEPKETPPTSPDTGGIADSPADAPSRQFNRLRAAGELPPLAPDSLSEFVNPGESFGAMGAAANPNVERGPDGSIRPKVRSAADLVGAGPAVQQSRSKYASPNTEFEQRFQQARGGIGKLPLAARLRGFWNQITKSTMRGALPELPRNKQFGEARSALARYRDANAFGVIRTAELLERTVKPLSPDDYDLFTRKVILDDLVQTEGALPFGLDKETAQQEKERIDALVDDNEKVKASVTYRREWMDRMKADYIEAHKALGVHWSNRFTREDYFRHQVLYWARARQEEQAGVPARPGQAGRARINTGRGFQKQREGSELDINANYLQAEWEVATQMIADTERARSLARVKQQYDILPELREQAVEDDADWRDMVPRTHDEYQLRPGRSMFVANTIPEQLATRILEAAGEEVGITADSLGTALAMGSPFTPIVVPNEVAAQLESIDTRPDPTFMDKMVTQPLRWWKIWMLQSPRRVARYNIRNATEVDKAVAINPSVTKQIPRATRDLWALYTNNENRPAEVMEWVRRGGANSLVRINELQEVEELKRFKRLLDKASSRKSIAQLPEKAWRKYWDSVGMATDFRESILRYAAYRDYLAKLEDGGTVPPSKHASHPGEIEGITDNRDKAFRMSADVLGDYSDVSVFGQWLRTHAFPFWSFQELNARAYIRAVRNLAHDEQNTLRVGMKIAQRAGVRTALRSPVYLMRIGKAATLFYGFAALLAAWNRLLFPDADDELPTDIRRRPHITFGRDSEGHVLYFSRLGTAGDFLEWVGADAVYYDATDVLDGRRTLGEVARDYASAPVNKVFSGLSPFIKTPVETAAGQSLYPDVREPRRIRDRGDHVARQLGVVDEYRALSGKPSRSYLRGLLRSPVYETKPNASAYHELRDLKYRWLEREFGQRGGFSDSARSDALYNYKLALRYDDTEAADRYLQLYMSLGGTERGMRQSLEHMHPLGGLSKDRREAFLSSLRQEDRDLLPKAEAYYQEVLLGGEPLPAPSSRRRSAGRRRTRPQRSKRTR